MITHRYALGTQRVFPRARAAARPRRDRVLVRARLVFALDFPAAAPVPAPPLSAMPAHRPGHAGAVVVPDACSRGEPVAGESACWSRGWTRARRDFVEDAPALRPRVSVTSTRGARDVARPAVAPTACHLRHHRRRRPLRGSTRADHVDSRDPDGQSRRPRHPPLLPD